MLNKNTVLRSLPSNTSDNRGIQTDGLVQENKETILVSLTGGGLSTSCFSVNSVTIVCFLPILLWACSNSLGWYRENMDHLLPSRVRSAPWKTERVVPLLPFRPEWWLSLVLVQKMLAREREDLFCPPPAYLGKNQRQPHTWPSSYNSCPPSPLIFPTHHSLSHV